ncbi:50S ribosomal protein L16 [Candidatus Similichlamydia laticola]|uniref:50S ribosomal protein L16 n=1 Tax=Candidatus Similichlamydia laticola TaxID=2170265 RepID=UPI0015F0EED9|nr:50S ribosomal protein L16 [Candidatus Similichlamydia laticola]
MLMPKRSKYRKKQKGSLRGKTKRGAFVAIGDFGIQALERGRITAQQIEACRVAVSRSFQRHGKIILRIFPDVPVTKKPAETRQGSGKGAVDHWVAPVKPGRILFEVGNVPKARAQEALRLASFKLGIRTRFVERVEMV